MSASRGAARVRVIILAGFGLAALVIVAAVWGAVASYHAAPGCVDTCFGPVYDVVLGMGAFVLLIVGTAVTLILTTVLERRRARAGLPPPDPRE